MKGIKNTSRKYIIKIMILAITALIMSISYSNKVEAAIVDSYPLVFYFHSGYNDNVGFIYQYEYEDLFTVYVGDDGEVASVISNNTSIATASYNTSTRMLTIDFKNVSSKGFFSKYIYYKLQGSGVDAKYIWVSLPDTIYLDANGGSCSVSSIRVAGGTYHTGYYTSRFDGYESDSLLSVTPTRDGYIFDGWYTEKTGGTKVTTSTVYEDVDGYNPNTLTYYAHWIPESSTVNLNKGTGISAVSGAGSHQHNSSVTIDATVKTGYTWKNWTGYTTTTTKNYTFTMPANDITLTANATPNPNTPYKVEHYQQNINNNNYTLKETESKTGTTDTQVTPAVKTYTGFTSPSTQTVNINGDGSTVVKYYYTRNSYKLTLNKGAYAEGIGTLIGVGTYKYGKYVTINAALYSGYHFVNWTGSATYNRQSTSFYIYEDTILTANVAPNTYYVDYTKGLTNNTGTTATTTHTYDADVTLASNNFTGRSYTVVFSADKPEGTIGTVQNLPSTKTGNLSFKNWYVDATYNDGYYDAAKNLGVKNFESIPGARAKATAQWNSTSVVWTETPTLIGYDFSGWTYYNGANAGTSLVVTPDTQSYFSVIHANWTPRDDTKYTVNHWVQNIDAESDAHNTQNFTLVDSEVLQGTSDTYVTPAVKSYEGCTSPQPIRVKIEADGSTVVNYYYERIKVSLDIDGEYMVTHYPNTNGLCTFDVYINDKQVANDVREYFNDRLLFGSTWYVNDINPDAGKNYSGSDIKTEN